MFDETNYNLLVRSPFLLCSSLPHAKVINPENPRINPHPFNFWCLPYTIYPLQVCNTTIANLRPYSIYTDMI